MNDPQIWTLIGVFAAAMLGGLTLVTTMLTRVVRAEVGGLSTRFDALEKRFDHLDRDVQALADRMWRTDRDG